jgi:hypothetical protein
MRTGSQLPYGRSECRRDAFLIEHPPAVEISASTIVANNALRGQPIEGGGRCDVLIASAAVCLADAFPPPSRAICSCMPSFDLA